MYEFALCSSVRVSLDRLQVLRKMYHDRYAQVIAERTTEGVREAELASEALMDGIGELQELLWPLKVERQFALRQQYNAQVNLLKENGFIEASESGAGSGEALSFRGIDGERYELPSFKDILEHLAERRELTEMKADQGFTKLILVPFGMSMDKMLQTLGAYLREKNVKDVYGNTISQAEPVRLNLVDKTFNPKPIQGLDETGEVLYKPKTYNMLFSEAKTKKGILAEERAANHWCEGWRILLLQADKSGRGIALADSIVRQKRGTKYPRPVSGSFAAPQESLKRITSAPPSPGYVYEVGLTIEDTIIAHMTQIETNGVLLDDDIRAANPDTQLTGSVYISSHVSEIALVAGYARVPGEYTEYGASSDGGNYQITFGNRSSSMAFSSNCGARNGVEI